MKKFLIIFVLILIGVGTGVGIYLAVNKQQSSQQTTTTSTSTTGTTAQETPSAPLTYFSASIDKIEGNILTVTQKTGPDQTRNYRVKIDSNTKIYGSIAAKPAAVQSTSAIVPSTINPEELKVGQFVSIATTVDVNNNTSVKELTAVEIRLPPIMNVISGKVKSVEKNSVILEALPPLNPANFDPAKQTPPEKKDFTVKLTEKTEIYKNIYNPEEGKTTFDKLEPSGLKKDIIVSVFADSEILDKTEFTAQYIEVLPQPEEVNKTQTP